MLYGIRFDGGADRVGDTVENYTSRTRMTANTGMLR